MIKTATHVGTSREKTNIPINVVHASAAGSISKNLRVDIRFNDTLQAQKDYSEIKIGTTLFLLTMEKWRDKMRAEGEYRNGKS
jgi:hypothetical protein